MELLRLYTALLRRRWLVLQAVVFFAVAGVLLALLLPKNYVAASRVLVSSSDTSLSILSDLGLGEVAAGLSNSSDDITNKISLATTRPVLDEVIWRLQIRDSDGRLYTPEQLLVPGLTGELEAKANISITQQQGTDLLVFEARADDPELARLLADTTVKVATQRSQQRAKADTRAAREFIEVQLRVVQGEFDSALNDMAEAKSEEEVVDLESEMRAAISRLNELLLAYENNAAAIQEVRGRLAEQQAYQGRENLESVSPTTSAVNNKVSALQTALMELRRDRAQELTTKTEKHPDIANIDEMIVETEAELTEALDEQHALDPAVHSLQAQLKGLVQKGREIDAGIQRTTAEFESYPGKMRRLAQLQLAATAAETVYKSLQEQRYQIGVAEAMLVSDFQLVEPAKAPDKHSSPKLIANLVVGTALGLFFGLGLAFVFEYVDDTIKAPEDLDEVWEDLPRLGIVPRFKASGNARVLTDLPTTHPVSEAYRTIRNGLLFASLDKPLTLLGVSSAVPGEGKSTSCMNLAISFARDGKKVLVVDCDLRRPSQHRHFPSTSNHIGLTDVLTRKAEALEAIQDTPEENVKLLTSGPVPQDPARLVESLRLRQLLLDMGKTFDIVIVDTPPSLVVNDAIVISRAVDGMVLVIESGKTSRKLVADLRDRYRSAAIQPLGVVLNKMNFLTAGYGHYAKAYKAYLDDGSGKNKRKSSDTSGPKSQGGAA